MKMSSARRMWVGIAAGPVIVISALLLTALKEPNPDEAQVAETTRLAMESMQQIGSVDATAVDPDANTKSTQPAGDYNKSERPDLRQISEEKIPAMYKASEERLRRYFTGNQLEHFLEIDARYPEGYKGLTLPEGAPGSPEADESVQADYEFTGGVNDFKAETVNSSGDQADITGSATIWLNGAMVWPDSTQVVTTSNDVTFKAHLVLVGNEWKVDAYDDTFAPGSGP